MCCYCAAVLEPLKRFVESLRKHSDLLQAISSAVVAFFAVFALFSWRASIEILDQQKRAELIQNRAYISLNGALIEKHGMSYRAWFSLENAGNTPAHGLELVNYYSSNRIKEVIGSDVGGSGGYLGPHQSWKFSLNWSNEQVERIKQSSGDYYVLEIHYADYLGQKHIFIATLNVGLVDQRYEFFIKNQTEL